MFSVNIVIIWMSIIVITQQQNEIPKCGCKVLRQCYSDMLESLLHKEETGCVDNAAIGTSMLKIYLSAITKFCGDFVNVRTEHFTSEGKNLYEVVIHLHKNKDPSRNDDQNKETQPTILIDAGQEAGVEPVRLALLVIQSLVACNENTDQIEKIRWIILPSSNPDGMEFARNVKNYWRKNLRLSEDQFNFGVDISRNFDSQWGSCERVEAASSIFPGIGPASENETIFVKSMITKYKKGIKAYLSLRRNGHGIYYPYAYTRNNPPSSMLTKTAAAIASRVNLRAGSIHLFQNSSIFEVNGSPHCGHSVDLAYDMGIQLTFEMRVFMDSDNELLSKFQALPRNYDSTLRTGYMAGINELYNVVVNDHKKRKLY